MKWSDPGGARFGRGGAVGRKFASLVRVGLGSVAPRSVRVSVARVRQKAVRVTGLKESSAPRPAAWRKAWMPKMDRRHHDEAGRAAVRKGIELLRAWGIVRPEVHRGARASEKAVGRAFRRSAWRDVRRHHFDAAERPEVGRWAMVPLRARTVRREMRLMDGSGLSRRGAIAPAGFGLGDRRDPVRVDVPDRRRDWRVREAAATERPDINAGDADERRGPTDMARWLGTLFSDEARRPPSGVTGFDGRLSPIFPGRKPGF